VARLSIAPGIWTDDPGLSSQGRWVRGNNVRFRNGRPETIDLWRPLLDGDGLPVQVEGKARGIFVGLIPDGFAPGLDKVAVIIGTHRALYQLYYENAGYWVLERDYDFDNVVNPDHVADTFEFTNYYGNSPSARARSWFFSPYPTGVYATYVAGYSVVMEASGSTATYNLPFHAASFLTDDNYAVYVGAHLALSSNIHPAVAATLSRMSIVWSDQDAYTDFTINDLTLAGTQNLTDGRVAVGGGATTRGNLIWTDTALYLMRPLYDAEFVFGFDKIDRACGLVGPHAWVEADGRVFWISPQRAFHVYDGGSVQELRCTVRAETLDALLWRQAWGVFAHHDAVNSEVVWSIPRGRNDDNEIDGEVRYNYLEDLWSYGDIGRTCTMNRVEADFQIAVGSDGYIYEHGLTPSDTGVQPLGWSLETSPIDLATFADVPSYEQKLILNRLALDRVTTLPPSQEGAFEVVVRRRDWPAPSEAYSRDTVKVWHPDTRYHDLHAEGRQHNFVLRGNGTAKHRFGDLFPRVQEGSGE
jgi:hypothetical protein